MNPVELKKRDFRSLCLRALDAAGSRAAATNTWYLETGPYMVVYEHGYLLATEVIPDVEIATIWDDHNPPSGVDLEPITNALRALIVLDELSNV